jgi:selenoprotein W-related protein
MRVAIEYCVICNYEPRAAALAAEIHQAFPHADVKLIQASGGIFEVEMDGRKVFSKEALGRHAAPGEILQLITQAQPTT